MKVKSTVRPLPQYVLPALVLACAFCTPLANYSQIPPVSIREQLTFTEIDPGIEYGKVTIGEATKDEATGPWFINALRVDLSRASVRIVHALDEGVGLETVSSLAARHRAAAAINGGYFRTTGTYRGESNGLLVLDGKLISEPHFDREEFGLVTALHATEIVFGHLKYSGQVSLGNSKHAVDGLNRPGGKDELLIFTPQFHRTTLTPPEGTEVVVRKGRIVSAVDNRGSSEIPSNGFVVWANGKSREWLEAHARKGLRARFSWKLIPVEAGTERKWQRAYSVVGGGPQLIRDGKIDITYAAEKITPDFVNEGHPRTAIARLATGKVLLITVDGRQRGESVGMSLPMLADLLLQLGATDAMNLDGGGSTTMVVHNALVNRPSDEAGERPVGDAILIFSTTSPRRD